MWHLSKACSLTLDDAMRWETCWAAIKFKPSGNLIHTADAACQTERLHPACGVRIRFIRPFLDTFIETTFSLAALASHDYILKIVPTVYEDLSGRQRFSYQYTVANKVRHPSYNPHFPLDPTTKSCCFCTNHGSSVTTLTYGRSMYRRLKCALTRK